MPKKKRKPITVFWEGQPTAGRPGWNYRIEGEGGVAGPLRTKGTLEGNDVQCRASDATLERHARAVLRREGLAARNAKVDISGRPISCPRPTRKRRLKTATPPT